MAACTALVCEVQCFIPVRLGHWQSQTSNICSEMTGQWSDRSAMSSHKTLSPPDPVSYLCGLAFILKKGRLRWYGHVERSNWAVKIASDMQVDRKHGPGRPKMTWKQLTQRIAESGSSRLSTLMIEICHACNKPATWKGVYWCGCCPCTCMLIKNPMMIQWR